MPRVISAALGRHPARWRIVGASFLTCVAAAAGVGLALYSQSMVNIEPKPVSSVMVGVLVPPTGDIAADAISVTADLAGVSGEQVDGVDVLLRFRAAGEGMSSGSIYPRFVLGGELVSPTFTCEGVTMPTVQFAELPVPEQMSVLLSIEDQLRQLQSLRSVSADELSESKIRETAYSMSYVIAYPTSIPDVSWYQSWPDDLRKLPLDSSESLEPAEKEFTGTEWSVACRGAVSTRQETQWGSRTEFPAVGVMVPPALRAPVSDDVSPDGSPEGATSGSAEASEDVPVEAETSVTLDTISTDLERISISEGRSRSTMVSETQRTDLISSTGLAGTDMSNFLDGADKESANSVFDTDSGYLSAARFSVRYSTAWFRASSQVALFACGVLFSLAAALLIAIAKTAVRKWLRAPKM